MYKRTLSIFILLLSFSANLYAQQKRYQATWESLKAYECPEWFRDVKFGIFIHWGVYSVPAFGNEWYPRNMYNKASKDYAHHIGKYGTLDKFGYKDFIPMFKAEKFNAAEWIDLFKKSGAKYIVPVAEHHDGFAMYNTSLSKWNSVEMGPKRDIIGELAEESKKQGLIFGLSSHRIEHWWFMNNGKKFETDVLDTKYSDYYGPAREESETMTPEYMSDWLLRSTELVDKYKPQLIWFDWWIEQAALEPYRKTFASYYYNQGLAWNKGVVLNYKNIAYPEGTAIYDIERGSSKATKKYPWQTDTSIGKKSWGYIDGEENKTPNELLDVFIDIVSKNGNMLLNIGPKADGTITEDQKNVLLEMGKWLSVNGEGIYGSRPWNVAGEGPTENPGDEIQFAEYKSKGYTEKDIRFTSKDNAVFAFLLDVPQQAILIKSFSSQSGKGTVIAIELVGSSEKIIWKQTADGLQLQPSKKYPSEHAVAYKIIVKK
jgi:alpha-L-fucosidase